MHKIRLSHVTGGLGALIILAAILPRPAGLSAGQAWTLAGLVLDILGASTLVTGPLVAWAATIRHSTGDVQFPLRLFKYLGPRDATLAERVGSEEVPDTVVGLVLLLVGFFFQAIGQLVMSSDVA